MLVIGLDVGTTGTKAVVVDESGRVLGGGYKEYGLVSVYGRVTQNANDWWDAAKFAIREAVKAIDDPSEIKAISLSTQGSSMVPVNEAGEPIYDVITWMDTRSKQEAEELAAAVGAEKIYRKCGWQVSPVLDAAKLIWLRRNENEVFSATDCFISTLEFINMHLTGRKVIDPTNAAIRQLFNIETGDWDDEILSACGITRERLPEVLPVGALVGNLTEDAARELGLSRDVKVYNGAHDQYCASLGSGAVEIGDMLLATGTTWVVLGVTPALLYTESHISPGIHPAPGAYGAMASIVSAGSALNWFKGIIGDGFKTIDEEAAKRCDGAKDLFVLPYVCGAGFPHGLPELRGSMFGLDVGHDKFHIARAVMEGVAFEAKAVLDEFARRGMKIDKLMMTGGAARSRLWSEIVGYVTGCNIYRMNEPETCCVGAAMTAAVGVGMFKSYDECRSAMVKREKLELGDSGMREFYAEKYARYQSLVEQVKNIKY